MENIPHSLPKRSFVSNNSNGGFNSHKSVYDDVFGGPPKFGLPTLAPRHEDYLEIFGGFHASRSSSIPVLDIPTIGDESELHFDARSPEFDYAEVFEDCRGLDWTASFEDVVAQSSGGYDSSDEAWSPSQSGSLSEELDPLAGSDKSHRLSNGDAQQSLESNPQFNVSYNKSSQRVTETVLAGTSHVTTFGAVPAHTSSQYETSIPRNGDYEHCTMHVTEDINRNKEFGARAPVEEYYLKCSSNPHSGFNTHGNDINRSETHADFSSSLDRPFVTVSDISLQTKPSLLPPPSRPPPALAAKKAERDRSISKIKPSKGYTFEGVAEGSAQPFFNVEEDANFSSESMTHENEYVHAKQICVNESIERKKVWSHAKGEDVKKMEDKRNKIVGACSSFQGSSVLQSHGKETLKSAPSFEGRIGSRKNAERLSDSQGGQCDHIVDKTAGGVAGREETEYFEVVGKDVSIEPFDTVKDYDSLMQHTNPEAYRHLRTIDFEVCNQKEEIKKFKVTKEVLKLDEKRHETKRDGDVCAGDNKQQTRKLSTKLGDEIEFQEKVIPNKLACEHDLDRMIPNGALQPGESGIIDHRGSVKEHEVENNCNVNGVETREKFNASSKIMEIEKKFVDAQTAEENNGKHEENIVREECHMVLEDEGRPETREKIPEKLEQEGLKNQQNRTCGKEDENRVMESHVLIENEMILDETNIHERVKRSCTSVGHERKGDVKISLELGKDKEMLIEGGKPRVNEVTFRRAFQQSGNYEEQERAPEWEVTKETNEDVLKREDSDLRVRKAESNLGKKGGYFEIKANEHFSRYTVIQELSGQPEGSEPVESNRHEGDVNWDIESDVIVEGDQLKVPDGACELDTGAATRVAKKHDDLHMLETAEEAFSCEENMELKTQPGCTKNEYEDGLGDPLIKVKFNKFSTSNDEFQDGNSSNVKDDVEVTSLPKQKINSNIGGSEAVFTRVVTEKTASATSCNHETRKIISNKDDREQKMKGSHIIIEEVDIRDSFTPCPAFKEPGVNGRKVQDASPSLEPNQDPKYSRRNATKQSIERNDKNMKQNLAAKDPKVGERIRRELENERIRKVEEEREREREREKDRMAVDKAALEARERSYAEARERAAVERATTEVRQRAMAEARERLEKTSMDARFRAERTAVEKATAEARQRAVEKSMAEKAAFDARGRVEKPVSDRFSVFHRPADTRQSSLSSDLHSQNTGMSNGLRHSYFSANVGAEGESPQRCKARLERYRRTAERAANALAEKNMRDLLAQKEREERNRVAEVLDAEVKRWSSGKEGNLRALLSTLQYILGPDSGWHPVPLTEVITSAAVKKAYRKATLCVHPDKLQQRGATIQQKYICEKVFDLLKAAWNKFNSEER